MLINEMIIFYHVVQLKSFSQSAMKLKVSKSYISKHITQLEKALKVKLLNRSTRQVSLTNEGEVFYQHCQTLFEQVQIGYDAIANLRKLATGTLKMSVPPAFALHVLKRPMAEFIKANPEVKLNIILDSSIENIIEQGYDLALRSAILQDSNLMAQRLGTIQNILCASPVYVKEHGLPQNLEQLSNHRFAVYSSGKLVHELKFTKGNRQFRIVIDPCLQCNSADLILQMVLYGDCIAVLPEFMVKEALLEQNLIACLSDYKLADSPFYAIYPDRKFVPLRVKMFVEILKKYYHDNGDISI